MMYKDGEKRHVKKPGRPKYSSLYSGKCDVRLTAEENSMLNHLAELNEVSRSDVVRRAIKDFYKFNREDET